MNFVPVETTHVAFLKFNRRGEQSHSQCGGATTGQWWNPVNEAGGKRQPLDQMTRN
ncbi:MAG: hypothetical protein H0X66_08850 [Verrucomicrobia bacterium]|nr:hypothetical protein [Verrucomicrobiota bacterium]